MRPIRLVLALVTLASLAACSASDGSRDDADGSGGDPTTGATGPVTTGGLGGVGGVGGGASGLGGLAGSGGTGAAGTGGGPTCTDVCAVGTSECFGNATRSCAVQGTGCADWNQPAACAAGQTCQGGQCLAGCSNPCLAGEWQCVGIQLAQCVADSAGCTSWGTATDCPAGQTCNGGACTASCTDLCTEGATQCAGAQVQTCARQQNGCTDWNPAADCPTNQACVGDACVSSCTELCTEGALRCSGDQIQTCARQATGCADWNLPVDCGTREVCSAGQCVATCTDACTSGTTQCSGTQLQTCTLQSTGCTGWSTAATCPSGQSCQGSQCTPTGTGGSGGGGSGGTGGGGSGGTGGGTGGSAGTCDAGTTTTQWATSCPTSAPACTSGTWTAWGSSSPENYPFRYETAHFAFYWPDGRSVTLAQAQAAGEFLENVVWTTYFGNPIYFPEIDCNQANKRKTSIHIIESGLYGGCNNGRPGIWVGPGAMADHWGLAHEFMHAVQCMNPGFADCGAGGCWIHESHANFMPHQLAEYRSNVHCSEMLVNAPHLYYGSTRDRYCNWQFFEFLKDKHCYDAVNKLWTATAPTGQRDPWNKLALNMSWNAEQVNDVFGEWAMHNITWDYKNPPPTSGTNQGSTYRSSYAAITDKSGPERRVRTSRLQPVDAQWAANRRFMSPFYWAPQRFGYNVVRLYPETGATSVTVTFRGVVQSGADSGWRWGLVATDSGLTTSRYSALQRGSDAQLTFCVNSGESLWLVVTATPTTIQKIIWDQAYPSIYRYPYMVEVRGAWPEGFRGGQQDACPSGTVRHSNGGGCAPSGLASSVYVGPYAQVLGGNVSGTARIEDHAVILNGATVSGGTVSALGVLSRFTVSGSARVDTTFYPPGFFESGQGLSGTARLFGDVEYRGQGLNRSSGSFYGYVDASTASAAINDVTVAPPYSWRP